jgi:hypothetical protein
MGQRRCEPGKRLIQLARKTVPKENALASRTYDRLIAKRFLKARLRKAKEGISSALYHFVDMRNDVNTSNGIGQTNITLVKELSSLLDFVKENGMSRVHENLMKSKMKNVEATATTEGETK